MSDLFDSIQKRHGAYLPHWTRIGSWYAVTIRLWDSIPTTVLKAWAWERKNIIVTAQQMKRPLSAREEQRLLYLYSNKIEQYLDAGFGSCYLKEPPVTKLVARAINYFEIERYDLAAWCVMPNHVARRSETPR